MALGLTGGSAEHADAAATFTVNSTGSLPDANSGNGVCANKSGACTLRAAIHEANSLPGADTIQVPAGTYAISPPASEPNDILSGDLDISDELTINGAGSASTIIVGGRRDRLFEVHSLTGNVNINDVTIRAGSHSQSGAGIMNAGDASVTVARSVIFSNKAAKFGGGIANAGNGTVRLLNQTRLSGNLAGEAGSAVSNLAAGTIRIVQSTISANKETLGGAAISNTGIAPDEGTVSLLRAKVLNNVAASATNAGGGIGNAGDGSVTVDRSTISGNRAAGDGGGLSNAGGGSVTVVLSTISGNRSSADGGGIANTGSGTVDVASSTISDNRADGDVVDGGESNGGGISNAGEGTVSVSSSTFSNNLTTGEGGGIQNSLKGELSVTGSGFSGNSALDGGGIYTSGDQGATVIDSALSSNKASRNGAGLNSNGTTGGALTVERVEFGGNQATADGGGLILEGGAATITDSDFSANSALSGGGFANHSGGVVTLADSTFTNNTAQDQGGGIDNRSDGTFTLTRIQVSGNKATQGGGIDSHSDAAVTLTHSEISGNQAERGGGIATNMDASDVVENTTVSGNTASVEGGGVLVLAPVTLSSATIAHNSAPVGGGIHKVGDSKLFLSNTIIASNPGGNCGFRDQTLPIDSLGGNVDSGITCALSHPTDLSGVDPLLGPLQDNGGPTLTHALDPASPALERAVSNGCPATDQRGVTRPQHGACDSGAFELDTAIAPPSCTDPGTRTVSASADSWVDEHDPAKNFGTDQELKVRSATPGHAARSRALVRFDLPALPLGCDVQDATLRLEAGGGTDGRTLRVARLASGWTEGDVTWNNQPPTVVGVAVAASQVGTVEWAVTSQVQQLYSAPENQGFRIWDASENDTDSEQSFYSREAGGNPPPQLLISFG
jgi:CSLREA domain-containing protein